MSLVSRDSAHALHRFSVICVSLSFFFWFFASSPRKFPPDCKLAINLPSVGNLKCCDVWSPVDAFPKPCSINAAPRPHKAWIFARFLAGRQHWVTKNMLAMMADGWKFPYKRTRLCDSLVSCGRRLVIQWNHHVDIHYAGGIQFRSWGSLNYGQPSDKADATVEIKCSSSCFS